MLSTELKQHNLQEHYVGISIRRAQNGVSVHPREAFRLHECATVISVDKYVLPLAINAQNRDNYMDVGVGHDGLTNGAISTVVREDWPIFMLAALFAVDDRSQDVFVLALSYLLPISNAGLRRWDHTRDVARNDVPPLERLPLLGFDIASIYGLSLLSGCGYTEEDRFQAVKEPWFPRLNHFHLLSTLDAAMSCRRYQNERVTEEDGYIWVIRGMRLHATVD
ncbi:MAG: hypothetical protein SFY69_05980 [Planctomycetota bacterium]|nr:hypothetical protein [Planctomycetota bacterium]